MVKIIFESFVDIFNTSKTGISFYDQLLNIKDSEYMKFNKGVVGHIERMTANQYIQTVADKVFDCSFERAKAGVSQSKVDKYAEMMKSGTKFNLPYINLHPYFGESQEGRHRMLSMAKAFGEDTQGSVLVVEPYEPDDKEIEEYCKKKYGKDYKWGISYINQTLDNYLDRHNEEDSDEDDDDEFTTVSAIELEVGDIIDLGDGWSEINRIDLSGGYDLHSSKIFATVVKSDKDVEYVVDDSDEVKIKE